MSVEIELVGGPADGKQLVINGDPMDPPLTTELLAPEDFNWREFEAGRAPETRKLLYRREANAADNGPLWLYRYDQQASAGPVRPGEEPTT
ncbi:hypothetical protein [Streptomyces sp. S1D4-20]|uniref:hypothetical protein n=1 Tax=Streptomyces sp. S1D4-20 TaxID=2594462 RepID=UPI00116518EA|nr:hypothetical protein [Streptomyces sp. S1D4-20]QDN57371.1 hypothetical protein FNV67_20305 [Streptomyces sp. S1D4-20]